MNTSELIAAYGNAAATATMAADMLPHDGPDNEDVKMIGAVLAARAMLEHLRRHETDPARHSVYTVLIELVGFLRDKLIEFLPEDEELNWDSHPVQARGALLAAVLLLETLAAEAERLKAS